jgi:uncharacterized membrane protein YfcA
MLTTLPLSTIGVLTFFSIFTSALSAATGMGGGVLLFSVMTLAFPIKTLIPIHGLIQFFNNLFIVYFLKKHLRFDFLKPFFLGGTLGLFIGIFLLNKIISTKIPYLIIIALVLYSLFKPKKLPHLNFKPKGFFFVGLLTGFLGLIAGAVDPILGPFFIRDDLTKEEIIANKAMMQIFVHFSKIPIFIFLMNFNFLPYFSFCLLLNLASFFGTKYGIVILEKLSPKTFILVFKLALSATCIRLIYKLISS